MEENEEEPTVSIIPCMYFVRRGVAKAIPDKIELTDNELENIIKQTAEDLRVTEAGDDQSDEEGGAAAALDTPANPDDEFNFENYDEDEPNNPLGLGTVATVPNLGDLGEDVNIVTEGPDSDEEDDIIKPTDNLLLVGHVENDASVLEVYVYNKEEGSFYVHHDIILPWFPLCIEWLSHDPTDPKPGNLCALSGIDPVIQVWDLDIENCLEPAFKLGVKPSKRRKIERVGHRKAVLDMSWNKNFTHILASGSADSTVLLWDLDKGLPHTKLDYFQDTVQSVNFHPLEAQTLLTGACDGFARITDCRTPNAHRDWNLSPELERVTWDVFNPFCFAMSNNEGKVAYVDCREDEPLWTITAHEKEVTGLILSDIVKGLMITTSTDGKLKVWNILGDPVLVSERTNKVGATLCAAICPESPTSVAIGGDNKENNIEIVDIGKDKQFSQFFQLCPLHAAPEETESMES